MGEAIGGQKTSRGNESDAEEQQDTRRAHLTANDIAHATKDAGWGRGAESDGGLEDDASAVRSGCRSRRHPSSLQ